MDRAFSLAQLISFINCKSYYFCYNSLRENTFIFMPDKDTQSTQTLRDALMDALEARGLNISRLAELTDIPERYLAALRDNDTKKLPAAPYIRGYLMKIGQTLDIDGKALWDIYRNQNPVRTSGVQDRLPINRFAIKSSNKKLIIAGAILLLAIAVLIWKGNDFLGTPKLDITNPVLNNFVTTTSTINLAGDISPKDKLTINGEEIIVDSSGHFEKDFPLQQGVNTVEFKVKRFLGRETTVDKQIIYQP